MNALNYNSLCQEAQLHYYDFICDETHSSVPDSITDHIEQCQHCRQQIKQLEEVLSQTEDQAISGQDQTRVAITKWLELHLVYIDKHVGAEQGNFHHLFAVGPLPHGLYKRQVGINTLFQQSLKSQLFKPGAGIYCVPFGDLIYLHRIHLTFSFRIRVKHSNLIKI